MSSVENKLKEIVDGIFAAEGFKTASLKRFGIGDVPNLPDYYRRAKAKCRESGLDVQNKSILEAIRDCAVVFQEDEPPDLGGDFGSSTTTAIGAMVDRLIGLHVT